MRPVRIFVACWYLLASSNLAYASLELAPPLSKQVRGEFACAGMHCGCRTAEQCRLHCCCFPETTRRQHAASVTVPVDAAAIVACAGHQEEGLAGTPVLGPHLPPRTCAPLRMMASMPRPQGPAAPRASIPQDPPDKVPIF